MKPRFVITRGLSALTALLVGLLLLCNTNTSLAGERRSLAPPHSNNSLTPVVAQNPRLGLTFSNYFDGNPMYARAREAGASYDRIEFQMSVLNPAQGSWNWSAYDTLVSDESAHGLQVLAVLTAPPLWAADPTYLPHYESWPVPTNLALPWNHPDNHWAQFIYQTVMRYKAHVNAWQVWNEPDIRKYWQMPEVPASLFAQLLRVSYQAIKAADPQATVVMGGFLYRHDQWPSPVTVWQAIRDLPDSAIHNNYFDVMAFHLYDGGTCEHFDVIEDFRLNMTRPNQGGLLDHPIWITESGIRHWEGQAPRNPGDRFATPEEAASYVIQNYAYALSKNVGRYYYFRTTDTPNGDGTVDVNRWGLIRTDQTLRPAYKAFQVAAQYLPTTFAFSTRPSWYPAGPGDVVTNPISRISFWGTPLGRVSVIWNVSNSAQTYVFNTVVPTATVVWQNGITATISAPGNRYTFTLPPAPNFYWHNPPDDCLVASPPLILIESDTTPPISTLNALPGTSSQTSIMLTWTGADPPDMYGQAAGIWNYDLQYRVNDGGWIPLQLSYNGTSVQFNGQMGQRYAFRVRARDRAGNEQDWASANVVTTQITGSGSSYAYLPFVSHAPAPLCMAPIVNGGFEQDGGWEINPTLYPATYTLSIAHGGIRAMQTGIPLDASDPPTLTFSSISQTLQLPAGTSLSLQLWRATQTQDTDDSFYVRLWDQYGTLHTLAETFTATPGWQSLSFDLTPYAGQRITLLLGTRNDGDGLRSVAYYDDIVLTCD